MLAVAIIVCRTILHTCSLQAKSYPGSACSISIILTLDIDPSYTHQCARREHLAQVYGLKENEFCLKSRFDKRPALRSDGDGPTW